MPHFHQINISSVSREMLLHAKDIQYFYNVGIRGAMKNPGQIDSKAADILSRAKDMLLTYNRNLIEFRQSLLAFSKDPNEQTLSKVSRYGRIVSLVQGAFYHNLTI